MKSMKLPGSILLIVGIACFAFLITGLVGWTAPVTAEATPASLAGDVSVRMLALAAIGSVCVIAGLVLMVRGCRQARR